MDPIEQGFLQALREDPLDRTTRLVYADWLADRDEPRGDFLREEAELAALASGEARARELQARLRHVAMAFDSDWVTDASLVAYHLFERWRDLEKSFVPYHGGGESIARSKRCEQWQQAIAELGRQFADRFPALAVGDHFSVPLDYTLFQISIGSGWVREGRPRVELMLLSIDEVREGSIFWMEHSAESIDPAGLWLSVGRPWSTHREHHLCCDRLHFAFGSVYESLDDSGPWHLDIEYMDLLAPSFLDDLRTITP